MVVPLWFACLCCTLSAWVLAIIPHYLDQGQACYKQKVPPQGLAIILCIVEISLLHFAAPGLNANLVSQGNIGAQVQSGEYRPI